LHSNTFIMNSKVLLTSLTLLASAQLQAQDFLGLSTGNYAGVTGVHLQPASIADSRYRFDINLTSFSLGFKSNFVGFDRSYAVNNRFSFKGISDFYDFRKKSLSKIPMETGQKGYADITNTVQIPVSFMMSTGRKGAIALNMRTRTAFAMENIPQGMINTLFDITPNTTTLNGAYNADNFAMRGVSWLDLGLTLARTIVDAKHNFVKVGITGKYIGGLSSIYMISDKLDINAVRPDSIVFNSNGSGIQYGHSATNFNVRPENYRPDAVSFGFDAGIVYEFRGRASKFTLGKYNDKGELVKKKRRDKNKYTLRLGASILDFGVMNFNSTDKARNFTINKALNLTNTGIYNVATFDNYVNSAINSYTSTEPNAYSIVLPTSYNLQADLHLLGGIYVNGMINRPIDMFYKDATFRTYTPEFVAITPRWESRFAGIYVPFVQNNKKDWTIGTTLRFGPVFAGTNNLATLFKSTSIDEADVHFGLKLPLGYGRPSKTFQRLNKLQKQITGDTTKNVLDQMIETQNKEAKKEEIMEGNEYLLNGSDTTIVVMPDMEMNNTNEIEAELEATKQRLAEAEAKIKDMEAANTYTVMPNNNKEEKVEEKKEKPADKKAPAAEGNSNQPVKIIINNYNAPGGGMQQDIEVETEGDLEMEIQMLKKKIEQKEKLIKELKDADGSTGCVELKKKFLA
jgi:hypothetical protein